MKNSTIILFIACALLVGGSCQVADNRTRRIYHVLRSLGSPEHTERFDAAALIAPANARVQLPPTRP